LDIQLLKA